MLLSLLIRPSDLAVPPYPFKPSDQIYIKRYEFGSFAENIG